MDFCLFDDQRPRYHWNRHRNSKFLSELEFFRFNLKLSSGLVSNLDRNELNWGWFDFFGNNVLIVVLNFGFDQFSNCYEFNMHRKYRNWELNEKKPSFGFC